MVSQVELCHSSFSSVGKTPMLLCNGSPVLCHSSFSSVGKTRRPTELKAGELCHSSFSSVGKTGRGGSACAWGFATVPFPVSARPWT